ncbi:hypothetical protein BV898_05571 [Hypsibius exemplaris]|uniref:Uncharacterized protein n=1 Tax=Hypsibius exemplaris TaxID=2072580 RepID=A0A1W0WZ92_HYPEX|nr:hypothetical protein BV898_05571 [Hypsibius exemplaris]
MDAVSLANLAAAARWIKYEGFALKELRRELLVEIFRCCDLPLRIKLRQLIQKVIVYCSVDQILKFRLQLRLLTVGEFLGDHVRHVSFTDGGPRGRHPTQTGSLECLKWFAGITPNVSHYRLLRVVFAQGRSFDPVCKQLSHYWSTSFCNNQIDKRPVLKTLTLTSCVVSHIHMYDGRYYAETVANLRRVRLPELSVGWTKDGLRLLTHPAQLRRPVMRLLRPICPP